MYCALCIVYNHVCTSYSALCIVYCVDGGPGKPSDDNPQSDLWPYARFSGVLAYLHARHKDQRTVCSLGHGEIHSSTGVGTSGDGGQGSSTGWHLCCLHRDLLKTDFIENALGCLYEGCLKQV